MTEQRMRVSPTRIRIPDVALLPPGRQPEIITSPPILVVEILSPEHRYGNIVAKVREYLAWGVYTAWIINHEGEADGLVGEIWTRPGIGIPAKTLTVSGTDIYLKLVDLF